ncbi:exodeoxyribonuclease VII small subunit [Nakamurella sp. YIM 132087]|uniref:Exodeoxyribonuclease 7 small subunit n=1 Tax=Nakamurella alba TaxID=2665158 RepID=A0A7K1FFG3_9ACTN|nr:exodeoxyribonuclease VII small subunit [Nakamurella alba]MTD12861.1 exodeoxyribonuclease VII small subunit [Nakamurella alba]
MSARKAPATGNGADPADGTADRAATYEQARDELAEVVGRLEQGGLTLDESLALWERGEHLAGVCTTFLDGARERVEAALAEAGDD